MISAYNQHATVSHSDFAWMGGSAIAAWVRCTDCFALLVLGGLAATGVTTII